MDLSRMLSGATGDGGASRRAQPASTDCPRNAACSTPRARYRRVSNESQNTFSLPFTLANTIAASYVSAFASVASVASAELLLRARLSDIPEARMAFVDEAAGRMAESNRLQGEANTAFSLALPVVV